MLFHLSCQERWNWVSTVWSYIFSRHHGFKLEIFSHYSQNYKCVYLLMIRQGPLVSAIAILQILSTVHLSMQGQSRETSQVEAKHKTQTTHSQLYPWPLRTTNPSEGNKQGLFCFCSQIIISRFSVMKDFKAGATAAYLIRDTDSPSASMSCRPFGVTSVLHNTDQRDS